MDGEELADGVYGFTDRVVNWYLIADGQHLTVVDAGLPSGWDQLLRWLARHGRVPSDVRAVILTHAHVDHIGFVPKAVSDLVARVHVHPREAPLLEHPAKIAESERSPLLYALRYKATRRLILEVARSGGFFAKGVREYTTVEDGDELEHVPGKPRAVFTPGHTKGHCAFHLPRRGVVFSGDALVTVDPYTNLKGPRLVARAATWNSERALVSLTAIERLDGDLVVGGHGAPWRGSPAEAARLAREAGAV